MLARAHALSGAVVWLAAAPMDPGVAELSAGMLVAAGAALLPDLDTPTSTLARALGTPTRLLARVVGRLAGGHRAGTHSLLAVVAAWTGLSWVVQTPWGRFVAAVVCLVCLALVLHVLGSRHVRGRQALDPLPVAVAALLVVLGAVTLETIAFIAPAVGLGVAAHVLGDLLSDRGVPLLWPWPARQAVGAVTTGGLLERLLEGGLLLGIAWLLVTRLAPALLG